MASDALRNFGSSGKEAQGRYLGDLAQRERASHILRPDEVSGEYDAGRMLGTTLGGHMRAITHADLAAFRRNVQTAGKKFRGGITVKSVIDMSTPVDRERANREIRTAIPHQYLDGNVHFVTDASAQSDVKRHHVLVQFLGYSTALASPAKADDLVDSLVKGRIKFQCDCGRFKFWYRYIATIGNFVAGRPETGFPKIRNPNLVGVACKHLLRTMQQMGTPSVKIVLAKMIEKGRGASTQKATVLTAKQAKEIAKSQVKQAGGKRGIVESTGEKRTRLAQQRAITAVVKRARNQVIDAKKLAAVKRSFVQDARKLAAMGVMSQSQLKKLLEGIK